MNGENGLVSVGQLVVERHDDAVGDNGDDNGPFEQRPVDEPSCQPSNRAGRREKKEGGGPRVGHALLLLATGLFATHGKVGAEAGSRSPDEAH